VRFVFTLSDQSHHQGQTNRREPYSTVSLSADTLAAAQCANSFAQESSRVAAVALLSRSRCYTSTCSSRQHLSPEHNRNSEGVQRPAIDCVLLPFLFSGSFKSLKCVCYKVQTHNIYRK
jgi:hypothetical protein